MNKPPELVMKRLRKASSALNDPGLPGSIPRNNSKCVLEQFTDLLTVNGCEWQRFSTVRDAQEWLNPWAKTFKTVSTDPQVPDSLRTPQLEELSPLQADLGISMAVSAIAESGTAVLDSRSGRLGQLLPKTHLIWIDSHRIVRDLTTVLSTIKSNLPAAIGLHSGPSRSNDLGGIPVLGIHGPARVTIGILESEEFFS